MSTKQFIGSIDQGTTSTRCIIFDQRGDIIAMDQREHEQIYPKAGWVEHNPVEIWRNTQHVVAEAMKKARLTAADITAVGITNQRETTLLWDKATGQPLYNALVWMDTRTADLVAQYIKDGGADRLRARTGLPITTYFSGLKLRWILDNVPGAREKAEAGEALFGTIDTWLTWNLTGGPKGGIHITDVNNASRTQLMNIASLQWDEEILDLFHIPRGCLPEIRSSSEVYGEITVRSLNGVRLAGILGDQQAALFGQACLEPGAAKNTYGTGCFMLMNTGDKLVSSNYGLLTTVAYKLGDAPPAYALEGSIAITGALVQWLRDNLGIIRNSSDIETLARTVDDNGDVYFVPAFSGLYAPHWESSARGVIAGLTRFANKGHIARAALEASCYQVREVLEAMVKDSGVEISELRADGGMTVNDFVMQFQADILDVPVVRPKIVETTALGAAYSAGLAVGYWKSTEDVVENWQVGHRWHAKMPKKERESLFASWEKAVQRSLNWVD